MTGTPKRKADVRTLEAERLRRAALDIVIDPSWDLNGEGEEYFRHIISARERDTWSSYDISVATELAWMWQQAALLKRTYDADPAPMVRNPRTGVISTNPILKELREMHADIRAMGDKLGLSASQRALTGKKQGVRNQAERTTARTDGVAKGRGLLG